MVWSRNTPKVARTDAVVLGCSSFVVNPTKVVSQMRTELTEHSHFDL